MYLIDSILFVIVVSMAVLVTFLIMVTGLSYIQTSNSYTTSHDLECTVLLGEPATYRDRGYSSDLCEGETKAIEVTTNRQGKIIPIIKRVD